MTIKLHQNQFLPSRWRLEKITRAAGEGGVKSLKPADVCGCEVIKGPRRGRGAGPSSLTVGSTTATYLSRSFHVFKPEKFDSAWASELHFFYQIFLEIGVEFICAETYLDD